MERFVGQRVCGPAGLELGVAARSTTEAGEIDVRELAKLSARLRREIGVVLGTAVGVELDAARLVVRVDEAAEEARAANADLSSGDLRGDLRQPVLLVDPVLVLREAD